MHVSGLIGALVSSLIGVSLYRFCVKLIYDRSLIPLEQFTEMGILNLRKCYFENFSLAVLNSQMRLNFSENGDCTFES